MTGTSGFGLASAVSPPVERDDRETEDLEQQLRPCVGRDVAGVVLRRDLDDIAADDVQPGEPSQKVERFARGQAADFGRARPGANAGSSASISNVR